MKRVRDTVREQRLDSRPRREHLELSDTARRRIAVPRGGDVATYLTRDAGEQTEGRHRQRVARPAPGKTRRRGYAAKNGVEM